MDSKSPKIIGVSCLLSVGNRWVLEVQKPSKWKHRPDRPPILGLACIGGTLESDETPIQALQREAREEINSNISVYSAKKTIDISPAGCKIVSNFSLDGFYPAMIWESSGPEFIPGLKVAVFHGVVEGNPMPGDLPAIILADPLLVLEVGSQGLSVKDLEKYGAEVRSKIDFPSDGQLQLEGTLQFVYDLYGSENSLI